MMTRLTTAGLSSSSSLLSEAKVWPRSASSNVESANVRHYSDTFVMLINRTRLLFSLLKGGEDGMGLNLRER